MYIAGFAGSDLDAEATCSAMGCRWELEWMRSAIFLVLRAPATAWPQRPLRLTHGRYTPWLRAAAAAWPQRPLRTSLPSHGAVGRLLAAAWPQRCLRHNDTVGIDVHVDPPVHRRVGHRHGWLVEVENCDVHLSAAWLRKPLRHGLLRAAGGSCRSPAVAWPQRPLRRTASPHTLTESGSGTAAEAIEIHTPAPRRARTRPGAAWPQRPLRLFETLEQQPCKCRQQHGRRGH